MSLQNILTNWSQYRKGHEQGGFHTYEHMWGMAIDLNKCIGCNACSVACYAENNLPVVGKEFFSKGQAMHWLRIERYWDEPDLAPGVSEEFPSRGASFLPMMCQNCNAATCEPVCPVAATYHTPDGLNAQVYNRCIGSRYCSNNCPYRLRFFNFYSYYERSWPEPLNMQLNPDLTVRDKGVMEKCTFCVQRIRTAKDTARREERKVQDGEFSPACVQTCPTSALVFGDMLNKESKVSKIWAEHQVELGKTEQHKHNPELRGYRVFEALNTDPKVMYMERVREA
ncbi:MAG: molybdopterin oxidoreductase iron-sulfur binding subunit [Halothiobacillaceae bacterium]|nr:MAG: molybdopterin oxidoreductase iron-sulfur binding subunit [Halothiobacillaceae bacterium]